jgi:hypothetical protein
VNLNGNGSQYQRWDFDIGSLDNNAYFNFAQGADPSQWFGKSDTTINSASQGVLYSPFGSWALSLNSWSDPAMRARVAKVLKVVFTFTVVEAQKDRAPCDPCFGPFGMPFLSNPTQWRWAADNETAAPVLQCPTLSELLAGPSPKNVPLPGTPPPPSPPSSSSSSGAAIGGGVSAVVLLAAAAAALVWRRRRDTSAKPATQQGIELADVQNPALQRTTSGEVVKNRPPSKSMNEAITLHEGTLSKKGTGALAKWQPRRFKLASHYLAYTDKTHEMTRSIDLDGVASCTVVGKDIMLVVVKDDADAGAGLQTLRAADAQSATQWGAQINTAMQASRS